MTRIYLREDELPDDEAVANGHCPTCGQPLPEYDGR
jgi:uncharacterized Zn finger protein (UPF0148 family)